MVEIQSPNSELEYPQIDKDKEILHYVVKENDIATVKQLLSQGADINGKTKDNDDTPLHIATSMNRNESHYEVAEILLKNGADVNAINYEVKETPLFDAVIYGSIRFVQLFINFKADINVVNDKNESLLFSAALNDYNEEVLQMLINLGLEVNYRNYWKSTPLLRACSQGKSYNKVKILKCLLMNGANMNDFDDENLVALNYNILFHDYHDTKEVDDVNFIMEHTDWNIIPDEANFFKSRDDYENFSRLDYLWKVIMMHLAKLKELNISVNPTILTSISKFVDYNYYYEKCNEELSRAKKTKVGNSWITFYNLLVDRRKSLKNYAGNENLTKEYEKIDWDEKFPIYGVSIMKKVEKGVRRRKLFDKSANLLSYCLPIFNPTHLIIRDVLDCILGKKDLSKFCE